LLSLKALIRRVPSAAWMCALIALLNGIAWSIITPPFEGRDEPSHFAYVQQLAETGTLPRVVEGEHKEYSPEETLVLEGLQEPAIRLIPQRQSLSSVAQQETLETDVNAGLSREGSGEANVATSEPPLYYALETVPYTLGASNTLTQLELMRLFDAFLGALTVLLTFFFIQEVLPGARWAGVLGSLCVSVQPLFGFMSGTLNPETMLYTVSAALLLCLGRAFRRGLTRRSAIVLGALIAVGFMTKLNFVGVALGVFAGLILLGVREWRSRGPGTLALLAIATGVGVAPVALYVLVNLVSGHRLFGEVSGLAAEFANSSIFHAVSYVWEFYLPRLPGMMHYFRGVSTYRDLWFDRFVGLYGWLDTQFPTWVYNVALIPASAIALLCARALIVHRRAIRVRWLEFAAYAAVAFGVMVMVGFTSYTSDALQHREAYADPRYLVPLLPLLGAVVVLAVRGAGKRWAPVVGAAIVVVFLAHDIFSQMQEIARYYG
jgi:4-amino-4-deoxy-L-arabinose transferase-like glycosyltransferase